MNSRVFLKVFGTLMKLMGVLLLVPGAVAAYYGEPAGVISFAITAFLAMVSGMILERIGEEGEMGIKEGFALVALGWLGAAFFGSLPYIFCGIGVIDALFESMSGFTTTGASILTESNAQGYWIVNTSLADRSIATMVSGAAGKMLADAFLGAGNATLNSTLNATLNATTNISLNASQNITGSAAWFGGLKGSLLGTREPTYFGLLFWRSFSQWLGGMGIILLFIAILPKLGVAGRQLYKAEVPGPDKDALTPRIRRTAALLWGVYILFSAVQVALMMAAGMPLYDALCNMFATMATGGFSPQSASIAAYRSPLVEGIITLFMFLAGANFALHYKVLHGERLALLRDSEFKVYAVIILAATTVIMAWGGITGDILLKFRYAIFQVVSIMTTTGFATTDFDQWSAAAKFALLLLMIIGACAGSTGGAIKVVRILLTVKYGYRELFRALHPKAIKTVKLNGFTIKDEILNASVIFFGLYLIIFFFASLILAVLSYGDPAMDIETVTSAVATTLGNVGPGFGSVGPSFSFENVHPLGKVLLFLCMWIGRLEIVTPLVLFVPEFWKR